MRKLAVMLISCSSRTRIEQNRIGRSESDQRYDLHSHSITEPASPESLFFFFLPILDFCICL